MQEPAGEQFAMEEFYPRIVRKTIKQFSTESTLRLTLLITSMRYVNDAN
jgi:hypothetical protein